MDDWSITATFEKADDELRVVYGWASVAEQGGKPVIDRQGDVINVIELQKASHDFMSNVREGGVMHIRDSAGKLVKAGEIVESVVFTEELQKALGIDLGQTGWFIGYRVSHEPLWKAIKAGKYSAFSIGGSGNAVEVEIDG